MARGEHRGPARAKGKPVMVQALRGVSLVVLFLVCWSGVGSSAEERWALTTWPGQQVISVHASWADCRHDMEARTRTLKRLLVGEQSAGHALPETVSAYICVPATDTVDSRGPKGK